MILSIISKNQTVRITKIPLDTFLVQYLGSLGLVEGSIIEVRENFGKKHPMLLKIGNSHFALGREIVEQIEVEKVE